MKIAEVRKLLQSCDADRLRLIIAEMYKAIPKRVKEEQALDDLIQNPVPGKRKAVKQPPPDMLDLETDALEFIDNAYAQHYLAPNRVVPQRERPKWRFTAKRLCKQLRAAGEKPEDLELASQLLEKLYRMLCYSCSYVLFTAYDTFESVGIPQTDFFQRVLELKSKQEPMPEFVGKALDLILDAPVNRYTLPRQLVDILLELLTIPDLKLRLVAECEKRLASPRPSARPKKDAWSGDLSEYEWERRIHDLAKAGFRAYAALGEFQEAITFFKKNYKERDREVTLYVLLQMLEENKRLDEWVAEYQIALKSGISPRKGLREKYRALVDARVGGEERCAATA